MVSDFETLTSELLKKEEETMAIGAFNDKDCCIFRFPEEKNLVAVGYLDFIITDFEEPLELNTGEIFKIKWPASTILPGKRFSTTVVKKCSDWKICPAEVVRVGGGHYFIFLIELLYKVNVISSLYYVVHL